MARKIVSQQPSARSVDQPANGLTLTTEKLGKRFNREWVFKDLNFHFTPGKTYAVTGPNGSGKSTLLQVLWGQLPQTSGIIQYKKGDKEIRVEDICQHVSIATPYMELIDEFTLEEQLKFHFQLRPVREGLSLFELLDIFYLVHARDQVIGNFSSGMKQRVKLGLAFYTQADLVFLDEPSTNLDVRAFEWYLSELKKLPSECTVFIASNNPEEYADSSIRLNLTDFKK
jgi:ABC-type multidrug transport system ATPase subunit